MFYKVLQLFLAPLVKFLWVGSVNDRDNIPNDGAVILCSNHSSYLDFFILGSVLSRRVYFLAGEVFFKKALWRPLVKLTGQIRVDRDSKDKRGVYSGVEEVLSKGYVLGIFPEGTRSRDGKIHRGYNGAVKFASKYKIPIVPIGIIGSYDAWPPQNNMPKLKKCDIFIGQKYYVKSDDFDRETDILMNKIIDLTKVNVTQR